MNGTVVVKIGGAILARGSDSASRSDSAGGSDSASDGYALDLVAECAAAGRAAVVVHGGGPLVGEWSRRLGLETRFVNGLRVTDESTRDVALAVLAGLVNKRVVAAIAARGTRAVGISGVDAGLLAARRADPALGLVGEVVGVADGVLTELLRQGLVPVVAPAALAPDGEILNVNADAVAGAIAAGLGAELLVFVTDVDGVRDEHGQVRARLDADEIGRLRAKGVVSGGMVPKLEAAVLAAAAGCLTAIVHGRDRDGLRELARGGRAGTVVEPQVTRAPSGGRTTREGPIRERSDA